MIDLLEFGMTQRALMAGLLAGVACGVIGTYVVVKRIVFISGGISHASLGGVGLALWLGVHPLLGALAFSLLSAVIIGLAGLRRIEHEDTLIGAVWSAGMAIGVIFIGLTPGYAVDPQVYLFGNILFVTSNELALSAACDVLILILVALLYKEFLAISLDDEFAELRGLPIAALHLLLLCLVALTVVVLIQVVGMIMVIALLTLPPAISRFFTSRLHTMMAMSCLLGAAFNILGVYVSFRTNWPAGATIILGASLTYALVAGGRAVFSRPARAA